MMLIQNNTISTEYAVGQLMSLILPNNFEYIDAIKQSKTAKLVNPVNDTDFCMKMAESSLSEEWENEDDAYWESFI